MTDLTISSSLSLPIDAAAARFVALGKSGSGKTNAGVVFAEELLAHGVTTAILDVLGNMHGLRAAGEGPGLPIAILGGRNGDVPLRADRGAVVADLIASGVSAVIDLSEFTREDAQAFAADFFARLVPAVDRSRRNVHVIVEEAETFAPQTLTSKAQAAARTATTVFARVARNVGIGWTFSTQRPQLLAKDVIDSSTAFIAMRMTGDLAQAAIGAEVRSRIGKTLERSIIEDLPKLTRGEAWLVPDPDWLGDDREAQPVKFRFRWRHTFDSARPPKVGERREEPKQIADVDLDGLRAAMAEDVAIVHDRGQSGTYGDESLELQNLRAIVEAVHIELDLVRAERDLFKGIVTSMESTFHQIRASADSALLGLAAQIETANAEAAPGEPEQGAVHDDREDAVPAIDAAKSRPRHAAAVAPTRPSKASPSPATLVNGETKLGVGPMKILSALASTREGKARKVQLAFLSGFAVGGGSYRTYLSALRVAGVIQSDGDLISITAAGINAVGGLGGRRARSSRDVVSMFRAKLGTGPGKMFDALLDAWPDGLAREQIADRSGYEVAGGSFRTYLSALSAAQLTEKRGGKVRLVDELFPTGKL